MSGRTECIACTECTAHSGNERSVWLGLERSVVAVLNLVVRMVMGVQWPIQKMKAVKTVSLL